MKTRFEIRDGQPVLVKLPELDSFDDREVKPQNIFLHIGRKPILAFGNSDGDLAMLRYTKGGEWQRRWRCFCTMTTADAKWLTIAISN